VSPNDWEAGAAPPRVEWRDVLVSHRERALLRILLHRAELGYLTGVDYDTRQLLKHLAERYDASSSSVFTEEVEA
jgi:hypothetical protein